jgi:hypothetical protein
MHVSVSRADRDNQIALAQRWDDVAEPWQVRLGRVQYLTQVVGVLVHQPRKIVDQYRIAGTKVLLITLIDSSVHEGLEACFRGVARQSASAAFRVQFGDHRAHDMVLQSCQQRPEKLSQSAVPRSQGVMASQPVDERHQPTGDEIRREPRERPPLSAALIHQSPQPSGRVRRDPESVSSLHRRRLDSAGHLFDQVR